MATRKLIGTILAVVALFTFFFSWHVLRLIGLESWVPGWLVWLSLAGASLAFLLGDGSTSETVEPRGKAVFITGCDSGFGHNLAKRLDRLGFTVFAGCLFPDKDGAQSLKRETSDRLQLIPCDVTDDWQVQQALHTVTNNLGSCELWALVNNAGIAVFSEIEWCTVQQFQRLLDVNVIGVVRVTKAFLPSIRRCGGRVINIASLAGRFTIPAFTGYSMSKVACVAFSDGLRREMDKFGVRVITVEPGLYRTPISSPDYLVDMNRKNWAETPTEIKEDYGQEYFDAFLKNLKAHVNNARPNVDEVIDLMVEAVVTEDPKTRYVPYWLSYIRSSIIMYLPTSLADRLFKSYTCKAEVARTPKTPKTPKGGEKKFF
ncbi:17-beta-hydroxysteroid dehydrogenase type 6-like [Liolophura sinensis]|uniref:17-beta-hydroxysteroid dehydrogenase type 6-like n=1 Tax=Liolophura sinensis TaxID=3198878 RepID=UPI003158C9B8